ncbi:MAG: helix-turn-helix domain-containing protein [Acidimicrobiales bacterium]
MLVYQEYRFELDPNNQIRSALASNARAERFAYNWGLDLVSNHLEARRALVARRIGVVQRRGRRRAFATFRGRCGGVVPESARHVSSRLRSCEAAGLTVGRRLVRVARGA